LETNSWGGSSRYSPQFHIHVHVQVQCYSQPKYRSIPVIRHQFNWHSAAVQILQIGYKSSLLFLQIITGKTDLELLKYRIIAQTTLTGLKHEPESPEIVCLCSYQSYPAFRRWPSQKVDSCLQENNINDAIHNCIHILVVLS
jgi:hypothetical protein